MLKVAPESRRTLKEDLVPWKDEDLVPWKEDLVRIRQSD